MNDNADNNSIIDSQGFSNGLSVRDTCDIAVAGKVGGAMVFNGASDYIDIGSAASWANNSFAISLWCKPDDGQFSTYQTLYGINVGNGKIQMFINSTGTLRFIYHSKSEYAESITVESPNPVFNNGQENWHNIIVVVEKINTTQGRASLYFDGFLVIAGEIINDINMPLWNDTHHLFVGTYNNDDDPDIAYFSGSLDNVQIFNKALSTEEIAALWNNGNGTESLKFE